MVYTHGCKIDMISKGAETGGSVKKIYAKKYDFFFNKFLETKYETQGVTRTFLYILL